jgi:hypothetical protein
MVGHNTRDAGQILYHLIKDNVGAIADLSDLQNKIHQARHLFLNNPVRVMIESEKTSSAQLTQLLKLNFPFYHTRSLGKVLTWGEFEKKGSFIIDQRTSDYLTCL